MADISTPIWGFVGFILAVLGLGFSLLLLWLARQRRELSYHVASSTPLLSAREVADLNGRVQVLLDGKPAQDLDMQSIVVNVTNSGTVPIADEDYIDPITLNVGADATILAVTVVDSSPGGRPVVTTVRDSAVVIHPVPLQVGQSITLRLLVQGTSQMSLMAKVKGARIQEVGKQRSTASIQWSLAWSVAVVLVVASDAMPFFNPLLPVLTIAVGVWVAVWMAIVFIRLFQVEIELEATP